MITTTSLQNVFPFFLKNDEMANNSIYSPNGIQLLALRYMLVLGFSFCLCAVVFFFAFNWQVIPDWTKFSLIQIAFVVSVISTFYVGLNTFFGKFFLSSACLLIGVFLAVFGQIYQTGADSYMLFFTWAVAIFPFVLISVFSGLWLFWIALINLTIILYFDSAFAHLENVDQVLLCVLSLLNGMFLVLREVFQKKITWINTLYSRYILFAFLQLAIAGELLYSISDERISFYTVTSFILSVFLYVFFRYKRTDLLVLAFNLITNATLCIIYIITTSSFNTHSYVLISLLCVLLFGAVSLYIDALYKKLRKKNTTEMSTRSGESLDSQNVLNSQDIDVNAIDIIDKEKNFGDNSVSSITHNLSSVSSTLNSAVDSMANSIQNPFQAYSFVRATICAISSLITVGFVFIFLVLLHMGPFEGSLFILIMATMSLTLSLVLHNEYSKREKDTENTPYILVYQMLTTLLLPYALLTFFAYERSLSIEETALLFSILTAIIYPFITHNVSRIFTSLYSATCIFISTCAIPFVFFAFNVVALLFMVLGFLFQGKSKALYHLAQALFIGFFVLNTILLSDFLFFLDYSSGNDFYLSILFAVFCMVFYVLSLKKADQFYRKLSFRNTFCHGLFLCALLIFVYFHAFPVLYIWGMFAFSYYIGKKMLLKRVMFFSIPILSQYYYILNVNLLHKSYILMIAGLVLLTFCYITAIQNKKATQGKIYEK